MTQQQPTQQQPTQQQPTQQHQHAPRVLHPFKSSLPVLKQAAINPALLKEVKYRETLAHLLKDSIMYEKMLKAMGDLTDGCKIGIRYADRTLYIDKPSVFQGAVRWLYGQTRDKIKDYIETEIMGSRGFVILLYEVISESTDVIAMCASSTIILSTEIRTAYRNICAVNVNLLLLISHGLSVIRQNYAADAASDASDLDGYLAAVQRNLKDLRLQLETNINTFAYYLPSETRLSR